MLQPDSLVTDLMFTANASIDAAAQKALVDALGGQAAVETKQLIDVDRMLEPRQEMELSPSMPFRRRGERRVMIVDDLGEAGPPPRTDPTVEPILNRDFRPAKEALIAICTALPVRLGRLFVLGTWGDAVLVARSARDLRGICLLPYALDPQVDVDGKRRQTPLSQKEFEAKLVAFEKRLDELDEEQILERLKGINFERRGDLLIVDVLEADGTWDQRKSMALEAQLGAMDKLSLIPGAPQPKKAAAPDPKLAAAPKAPPPKPEPKPEPKGPPLAAKMLDDKVILVFPAERFDLDIAAAMGKRDWDTVVRRTDPLTGEMRDRMHRDGAAWIAPLEFLSEVFVDGKPLSKAQFEKDAQSHDGIRSLEVHFPRYGDATLLEVPGKGRFVTSLTSHAERAAALVAGVKLAVVAALAMLSAPAFADDDFGGGTIIFARGAALLRIDPRGKGEVELATLPAKTAVRALRTDAGGTVLLADLSAPGGLNKWTWLPLDGSTKSLTDLPCADGPAQLTEDGTAVLCRSPDPKVGAIVYDLAKKQASPLAIAAGGARLVGPPDSRSIVWADAAGIWTAPVGALGRRTKAAPTAPLRGFLPSPDGKRALGVYADEIYTDVHHKQAAEVLMNFALDGGGAKRKAIRDGVPVEWSHDGQWALVQDGGKACLMRASGGEYKCWKGFTAAAVAPDGSWALVLGDRKDGGGAGKAAPAQSKPDESTADDAEGEPMVPDVAVAPPSGPLSLYRAKLDGPYADAPALVVKVIDGAAVWVPKRN